MTFSEHLHSTYVTSAEMRSPIIVKGFGRENDLPKLLNQFGLHNGAEIGVRQGKYSERLCSNIEGVTLMSVDPWSLVFEDVETNAMGIELCERCYREAQARLASYKGCTLLRALSMDAVRNVPFNSLDFVYIDASHHFDYVMQDLIEWGRRVRSGGVISGHDYIRRRHFGVREAVNIYTRMHGIREWFLTDEGGRSPSFFWVKP